MILGAVRVDTNLCRASSLRQFLTSSGTVWVWLSSIRLLSSVLRTHRPLVNISSFVSISHICKELSGVTELASPEVALESEMPQSCTNMC